ncbi:MAG: hypothetical protein SPF89_02625 [Sphaerochaetaceae bacterium]|nr:hypothetical protein [Spirochaetales bacterium]MDY5498978.1 hypothetical protein [Sphaerochaetaceae bacterium]
MKKVLSVLAVLAVAAGFAFAGEVAEVAGAKEFVLKTTVAEEDPTFGLYYKLGAAGSETALANNEQITVDLKNNGEFHAIAKCLTSNKNADAHYSVTLTPDPAGKFMASNGLTGPKVTWDATKVESVAVSKGKLSGVQTLADFKATWSGDANIGAGSYSYTASISVATK